MSQHLRALDALSEDTLHFPPHKWWITTIYKSSLRVSDALFGLHGHCPQVIHKNLFIHVHKTLTH